MRSRLITTVFALPVAFSAAAFEEKALSPLDALEYTHPTLTIDTRHEPIQSLNDSDRAAAQASARSIGGATENALVDRRTGRFSRLLPALPMIPGRGNTLTGADPLSTAAQREAAARQALDAFFRDNAGNLRISADELGDVTVQSNAEHLVQFGVRQQSEGVPVRGARAHGTINNGNLVLFGLYQWTDVTTSPRASLSANQARQVISDHTAPFQGATIGKMRLEFIPVATGGQNSGAVDPGQGMTHRLAWVSNVQFDTGIARWEALVDAHTGELLSFRDLTHYATARTVTGGVLPQTNDGSDPLGTEQAGWPIPFDIVQTDSGPQVTDSAGNLAPVDGDITSNLSGLYVDTNDNCGAIELTSSDNIDFGTSGGTDCTTPGVGGPGNTHSARTVYHELNRVQENARGQLPGNTWLQSTVTSNVNINDNCNAGWNGTVNFFTSGGGCSNTGEIAAVVAHEWGHGMDDNDVEGTVASPSGEGIADVYAALRLNNSCIGTNFRPSTCGNFGAGCTSCTGVREIDWAQTTRNAPLDLTWANGVCGSVVHCRGLVYSGAIWDLWKRELPNAPYSLDDKAAQELVTYLTYLGAGNVSNWYVTNNGTEGGCSAASGYMNYLAADDDDGNLANGTPHMAAIFAAFDRHEIACATPTVQDAGCSGTPTTAPTVMATAIHQGANLSWSSVAGATSYEVFRTDSVLNCATGGVKVAETTDLSFSEQSLQIGRDYAYTVIPKGPSNSCFGPASTCATVTPINGPDLSIVAGSVDVTINTGDTDEFLDNCEVSTLSFDLINSGGASVTNAQVVNVSIPGLPGVVFSPIAGSSANLAPGETATYSFTFTPEGLTRGSGVEVSIDFDGDELFAAKSTSVFTPPTETDFSFQSTYAFDFESDYENWLVTSGTFDRTNNPPGGNGTDTYIASSSLADGQCDRIRSPQIRLTATTTMEMQTRYEIEEFGGQWWDRASVGLLDSASALTDIAPDGGRLYDTDDTIGAYSACNMGSEGFAGLQPSWATSSWSATALDSANRAGEAVQVQVTYATDGAVNDDGFRFDGVEFTDIELAVDDGFSDTCSLDPVPVGFSGGTSVTENGSALTLTMTQSMTAGSVTCHDISFSGSAVLDTDFTVSDDDAAAGIQICIPDSSTSSTIEITTIDDGVFEGIEEITVTSGSASVDVNLNDDETLPNLAFSTDEDTAGQTVFTGSDATALTFAAATPAQGLASVDNMADMLSFDPNGAFEALAAGDSDDIMFDYTSTDGTGAMQTATVTVTVNGVNDAPTAATDAYQAIADSVLTIAAGNGLIANDTDIDGPSLEVAAGSFTAGGIGGSLELASDGSFTYTPPAGMTGTATYTYTLTDGDASVPGMMEIEVISDNVFADGFEQ